MLPINFYHLPWNNSFAVSAAPHKLLYPKEIGYMLMKMNIGPGTRVVEAGTGSGGLTLALARMVMPHGHIYTYETRPEIQTLAQRNLEEVGTRGIRHVSCP